MASRFMARCARLLARSPRSSISAGHLHPITVQPEHPPCTLVLVRPSYRTFSLGPGPAPEEEQTITFSRTELDVLVEKAATPQEVLSLWAERGGTANQAGMCLIHLSRLMVEKPEGARADLLKDPRCVDLIQMVNSQMTGVWNGTLVSLLRSLSVLGLPVNAAVMRSLQTEALWRLRRFTYRHLCYLADWASSWQSQGQGNEPLTTAVLKQLELRWTELSDPRLIGTLMSRAARLSPPLMEKLEDKALELAEKFSAEDIRRVTLALALQGRRAVPLLRALSYHLHQKPSSELNTALLLDVAFAYGKLHFHQTQVFQRMAAELLPRLSDMSSTEVMRCSKSLAFLKWLHLPLFEGFAQHYLNNSDGYSTLQMCNLLMAFAKLNFQPSNKEQFFEKVHEALKCSWQSLEPFLLTDVVWSLCIFQQARPEYITAVRDSTFQSKLTGGGGARAENYMLKLLHIATSAQLESGIHPGTVLPSLPEKVSKPNQTAVQSSLYKALQVLTGNNVNTVRTDVNTIYGWTVDAELVVDSDNKLLNLESFEAPHLPGGGGSERLPQGAHRMAFLAWEFPHFVSRSKDLLGRFVMQRRHLQLAGFLIVEWPASRMLSHAGFKNSTELQNMIETLQHFSVIMLKLIWLVPLFISKVPYFEWLELKTDWQRVAYLKDKMGKAVAEDMAK